MTQKIQRGELCRAKGFGRPAPVSVYV